MSRIKSWAVSKVARLQTMQNEEGQGLAEYGLILALIAVVCIGALELLGTGISSKIGQVNAKL
jgi:pilus assembly protein Flp/PilA